MADMSEQVDSAALNLAKALEHARANNVLDCMDELRLAIPKIGLAVQHSERNLLNRNANTISGLTFPDDERTPSQEILLAVFHTLNLPGHLKDAEVTGRTDEGMNFSVTDKDGRQFLLVPVYVGRG